MMSRRISFGKTGFVLLFLSVLLSGISAQTLYSFDDLMNLMENNNAELQKAKQDFVQSTLDVKDAKAGFFPQAVLTAAGTYMFNPMMDDITINVDELLSGISWPGGLKPEPTGQYLKLYDGMENTQYSFTLDITQPVFTWGKLTNAVKLYNEVSDIKKLQLDSKRGQLAAELKTRLASAHYIGQILELLEVQKNYTERLLKISEEAWGQGALLYQDLLDARIQAKEIDIASVEINDQFSSLILGIEKITGLKNLTRDQLNFVPDDDGAVYNTEERKTLMDMALNDKQESIVILAKLEKVSEYSNKIAKASVYWKPDLALNISLGYSGSRFPLIETDWYRKNDYSANATIAIRTTVFDGGKKLNDIKRTQSVYESSQADAEQARTSIAQNLTQQFNAVDLSLAKIEYQRLKIENFDSKIAQQRQLFESGYGAETALIQAEIEKTSAQIQLLQHSLSLANARYVIEYLSSLPY